jgi:hypothetical protein
LAKLSSGKTDKSIIRLEFLGDSQAVYLFQVDQYQELIDTIQAVMQKDSPPLEPKSHDE